MPQVANMTAKGSTRVEPATDEKVVLSELIGSMRSRKALAGAGFLTVGDIRKPGALEKAMSVKFVGEATRLELERIAGPAAMAAMENPAEPEQDPDSVEEGPQPLMLQTSTVKNANLKVAYNPAHKVAGPGKSEMIQESMFLEFGPWVPKGRGVAKLSREMYLMRKYERDKRAVKEHVLAQKPWRKEAAEDLKSFSRFGVDFKLLTD